MTSTDVTSPRAHTIPLPILVALVVFVGSVAGAVERSLPIKLLDASGAPVAHARVTVVGTTGSVTTNAQGLFQLTPEPVPPFELAIFSQEGAWVGLIRVEQLADQGERALTLPPLERVEVNVRGGVAPSTFAPPAAAATVVSRTENEKREPSELVHVVQQVPGSGIVGQGHGAVPSLRGLAGGRTLLLLDDARVVSERRAGASATFLDPFSLELVEVVRGPGSVIYGSDAMGGIIHSRTSDPRSDDLLGRFRISAGGGIPTATIGAEVNVPAGKGAVLLQAHARDFDDYDSPDGTVPNSGASDRGFLVKGLVPGESSRWVLGLQVDNARDVGKPRRDLDSKTFYPDEESVRLTANADLPTFKNLSSVELRTFVGRYRLVTERETFATPTENAQLDRSDVDAWDASARFVTTHPIPAGSLRTGIDLVGRFNMSTDLLFEELDANGQPVSSLDQSSIESASRFDAGLFAEAEYLALRGKASVAGGLRLQGIWTRNRGGQFGDQSTSGGTPSGYLAGSFRPSDLWTVTTQVARGFREPTLSDRYFAGVTGRGFVVGNPDLEAETSLQWDVTAQRTTAITQVGLYAYHYTINDIIERYRIDPDEDNFTFRNRGKARIWGIEAEGDVAIGRAFAARVALNWTQGEIVDEIGDPYPDNIPAPSAQVSVHHRPGKKWWWRVGYLYYFRDDRPGPTEEETPSFGLVNASGGYSLPKNLELRLIVKNIFDKAFPASPDDDSVLGPGFATTLVFAGKF
jgi:outer membrane receptor protein involved in Fe transport